MSKRDQIILPGGEVFDPEQPVVDTTESLFHQYSLFGLGDFRLEHGLFTVFEQPGPFRDKLVFYRQQSEEEEVIPLFNYAKIDIAIDHVVVHTIRLVGTCSHDFTRRHARNERDRYRQRDDNVP